MKSTKMLIVGILAAALSFAGAPGAAADSIVATIPAFSGKSGELTTYVIEMRSAADAMIAGTSVQSAGGLLLHRFSHAMTGFSARLTPAQAAGLRSNPQVKSIVADAPTQASAAQTNPPWGLDRIDQRGRPGDLAYQFDTTGAGVTVFVIDTGIRLTHTEFGRRAVSGYDFVDRDADASDCYGHGTHVSGTIGGSTFGVAKAVTLVSLRVWDCNGSGTFSNMIAAMDWAVAHKPPGPSVINISGRGGAYQPMDDAVARTIAAGIPVVVAAGNDNDDACKYSPARAPGAITVGATDSSDNRASFSNYGTCEDMFAPGVNIQSAVNTSDTANEFWSGTSMATPHVTGIVARYLQGHPTAKPAEVATAVLGGATPNIVVNPAGSPNRLAYAPPPPTAPGVPTSVSASRNDTARTGTITWNPPASTGGSPVTGYRVTRDGTDKAGNGPVSTVVASGARSQTFSNLKPGSTYTLTVRAINAIGDGAAASGTIVMASAPSVPTAFTATKNNAARTGTITWNPPTSTGGSPVTGYRVSRDGTDKSGNGPVSTVVASSARSQTFSNLKPGSTYTLTVRAINVAGDGPAASGTITITG